MHIYCNLLLNMLGEGTITWAQHWQGEGLRYLTYFGMCLSTCIILQSSTFLAALVGLCVAAYITLSEYSILSTSQNADKSSNGANIWL